MISSIYAAYRKITLLRLHYWDIGNLVEGVGAGSPVGEEQAETDSLEDAAHGADGNGISRTLLGDDLGDDLMT